MAQGWSAEHKGEPEGPVPPIASVARNIWSSLTYFVKIPENFPPTVRSFAIPACCASLPALFPRFLLRPLSRCRFVVRRDYGAPVRSAGIWTRPKFLRTKFPGKFSPKHDLP